MRSTHLVPALAAGALLLAACGTSSDRNSAPTAPADAAITEAAATPDTQPAASASAPAADVAVAADDAADGDPVEDHAVAAPAVLQFSAPLVGGGELDASSLAGKPTVFWFWAPT